jgi:uncharacterized membrane protein YkoI
MKTITANRLAVAGLLASAAMLQAQTRNVPFDQLPWKVQHAFQSELGYGFTQPVTERNMNGQLVYEAQGSKAGQTKTFQFTSTGEPYSANVAVGSAASGQTGPTSSSTAAGSIPLANLAPVDFNSLPWQVQHAFQNEMGYTFQGPVQQGHRGRQLIYQAQVNKNGQARTLQFTSKGDVPGTSAPSATTPTVASSVTYSEPLMAPQRVQISGGTKVAVSQLPAEVRRIVESRAAGAPIEDIDRGTAEGETVYEVAFKSGGQNVELQVAEDATWIYDPRMGASGTVATTSSAPAAAPLQISNGTKIQLTQAPQAVQQALQQQTQGARVEDLEKGTAQGRTVYEAAFKSNGRNVELQVGEDGTVLYDPRSVGTAVGAPPTAQSGSASSKQVSKEEWKRMKEARKAQKRAEKEQRK